jgi:predicted ABC-type ATPase
MAFQIQTVAVSTIFVACTLNGRIQIGSIGADGAVTVLVSDTKNTAGDQRVQVGRCIIEAILTSLDVTSQMLVETVLTDQPYIELQVTCLQLERLMQI